MVHPNEEEDPDTEDEEEEEDVTKRGFKYYFNKLDTEILKPLLIHKYNAETLERQEQFVELIQNDKEAMFKVYGAIRETNINNDKSDMQFDSVTDRVTQAVVELAKDVK